MKKILFVFSAAVFILWSCSTPENKAGEKTASNGKVEKNLAAAKAVAEAFKTGNIASIDSVVAEDFIDHSDKGIVKGRDSLKAMINLMHKNAGNDMKMDVIREVGDDEYVFQWMHYTGTSDGSMGPKGPYDMHVIEISRYNNDSKVAEHWAYGDYAEMAKMMAAMQPPAGTPAADSAKKK